MELLKAVIKFVGASVVLASSVPALGLVTLDDYPFAPAAGVEGTSAVALSDPLIEGWATLIVAYLPGAEVDEIWRDTDEVLGPAEGDGVSIVSLGSGGQLTVQFEGAIENGEGWEFAVFENGFGDSFLELAWVEVSSDGATFVRFPNYSATADRVGTYGSMDTTKLYGFVGKYRQGFGTPFDLSELEEAYAAAVGSVSPFSIAYTEHLKSTYPTLDINNITHLRIVDVIGDGTSESAARSPDGNGYPIYDPWPTTGSAGADVDAVAARNFRSEETRLEQILTVYPIPHQLVGTFIRLPEFRSSSDLEVGLRLIDGPNGAYFDEETRELYTGSESGVIEMEAFQSGDSWYAPALEAFTVEVKAVDDDLAPESFEAWAWRMGIPAERSSDADGDGFEDILEYVGGTDPLNAEDRPLRVVVESNGLRCEWSVNLRATGITWPFELGENGRDSLPSGGLFEMTGNDAVRTYARYYERSENSPLLIQVLGIELNVRQ